MGKQKFGSSPFNQHYDRWLANVEAVLGEFESHPNITVDDQYLKERSQALDIIKLQFQDRRRKEDSIDQQLRVLSHWRSLLKQIDAEYANIIQATKSRKNADTKRLQANIANLKSEQDRVIRIKTGFFRGISERDREQKELEIAQQLSDIQTKLELALLDFNAEQKALRQQCEAKREPVLEQIKHFQKTIRDLETDGSLEERWFACEALIDAMNSFLLRKTTQPQN